MSFELLIDFINLFSALVCVILIALIIWQNASHKQHAIIFIILLFVLLGLIIWQINSSKPIGSFILLFILLLLFYQILKKFKNNKITQTPKDSTNHSALLITQAKEQERSRIYANLHDDVGAKLLELIYSAQDDKTKTLAKEVLSNIRQAVASTVNIQCTSQQLIDEILQESKLRLQSANISLSNNISFLQEKQKLPANVPTVISRIVREVISNTIKHSQAQSVQFNVTSDDGNLILTIKDDGIGFAQNNNGKGLKTIKKRAQAISANVEWKTQPKQGTTFTLNHPYGH